MVSNRTIYVSASTDEHLDPVQRSVKDAILAEIKANGFEAWSYSKEGPLRKGWGFRQASEAVSQCQGALVLGFAQWKCTGIGPREKETEGFKVSEGNHLEGGFAIAHGVPLLVVREEGTQDRGIVCEGPDHYVAPMPRGSTEDWAANDRVFREKLRQWWEDVKLHHSQRTRGKVLICHGHSRTWKDLKDFIQDRLELAWDEFNRVPIAGITNVDRLSQMLDHAAIGFLVMTAEDEQSDGTFHPRMNVIHEAGLLQGRLGFPRAILLLEEGCKEFSNVQGLGHVTFAAGKIDAVFEEVRRVCEREGLLAR